MITMHWAFAFFMACCFFAVGYLAAALANAGAEKEDTEWKLADDYEQAEPKKHLKRNRKD